SVVRNRYPSLRWLIELNPMTSIIEAFRYGFLGQGTFTLESLAITAGITLLILFAGIVIFNRVERNFIDTV
ncbi:MAG TPA: ABC transporter permease, partial [Mucilaginibacter sp.]|nr:ABC transporter permease [Mucilaginibacter sp.]